MSGFSALCSPKKTSNLMYSLIGRFFSDSMQTVSLRLENVCSNATRRGDSYIIFLICYVLLPRVSSGTIKKCNARTREDVNVRQFRY